GFEALGAHNMPKTFELAEFLVRELGLTSWAGAQPYPKKIAFHRACHGRGLGLRNEQEQLLASIPDIELLPINHAEQCCGFGGAFSVNEGQLSSGIGLEKLEQVLATGAEELVSGDMGCLMHLQGLIGRHKLPLRTRHFAEILAETIP
ncbi:MAG TPA: (Fe-S)-binding protein, partial [Fimbriimonadaceae bacterium]|nr:(Fe-S)-binding protein [Fimbriimonadaceae bacterium]